jgi:hypothetical protein
MKQFALAMLSAGLLAASGAAQAGEAGSSNVAGTTLLLLAEVSLTDGKVTALQSCLERELGAEMVSSFALKSEAVAPPAETSQPWLSCGEAGCP